MSTLAWEWSACYISDVQDDEHSPSWRGAERLVDELVDRATRVARAQRTLELLLEANRTILSELSLEAVLRRIVAAARELGQARYAALGVMGPDGTLEQFVHDGLGDVEVCPPGQLPQGVGLLGVLVREPRPLRLERMSEHPLSVGTPATHPDMESFLGVPIEVRGAVYGNLYLTERVGGGSFTEEDERAVVALAATAGIAVDNARLFDEARRRSLWSEAAAAVGSALLDPQPATDPVELVASTVLRLTDADVVSLVVPTGRRTLRVRLARGHGAQEVEGLEYEARNTLAELALREGRGVSVASLEEQPRFTLHLQQVMDVGAALALPLHGSIGTHGVLVVARRAGRPPFGPSDLELSESFAAQAAIALELGAAREDRERLLVLEDRERIARELHDHVIQRLYASGLTLESIAAAADPVTARRVGAVVDGLDATAHQSRTLIFRLQARAGVRDVRSVVLEAVQEVREVLGHEPEVEFKGPVDTVADPDLVDDVAAVVHEALSNVVRHARASTVSVRVSSTGGALSVVVADDGVGPEDGGRRSGLSNLARRGERHGGGCELVARPAGGTELVWWTSVV